MATQGFFDGEFQIGRLNQANLADLAGNAIGIPVAKVINQAVLEEFLDVLPVIGRRRPFSYAVSESPNSAPSSAPDID